MIPESWRAPGKVLVTQDLRGQAPPCNCESVLAAKAAQNARQSRCGANTTTCIPWLPTLITRPLLDLKTGINFTWMTQAAVRNRIYFRYNFLEKVAYLLLGASVVTDLHAACVSKNGKGILVFGDSGAGKSTLAYACARNGWTYTSDDTSYLINDSNPPRVIGHSHRARFRPSAKSLFPELEYRHLTPRLEGKPSIEVLDLRASGLEDGDGGERLTSSSI